MHPTHPSHEVVNLPPGPHTNKDGRPLMETLSSRYLPALEPYLHNGVISQVSYKRTLASIHSSAVQSAISNQRPNRVLQGPAQPVSQTERQLPRTY